MVETHGSSITEGLPMQLSVLTGLALRAICTIQR